MQPVEMVVVLGIAAVLTTVGYRAANERRDAARLAADVDSAAAIAVAYQAAGVDCGRPPGTLVAVEDMMAELRRERGGPTDPAAWSVRYYSRLVPMGSGWPPLGSPRPAGFAVDIVREPGATPAERAALERLGGRREGGHTVVARRVRLSGTHRGRRAFAAGRDFTGC